VEHWTEKIMHVRERGGIWEQGISHSSGTGEKENSGNF
jgi:hypothetical protein